ncbi:hypothetical protein D3C72_234750 [compost metagenome]
MGLSCHYLVIQRQYIGDDLILLSFEEYLRALNNLVKQPVEEGQVLVVWLQESY